jgi:hypothetical protein
MCRIPMTPAEDIGSALVAGYRRQVLLAAEQEAEDWAAHLPTDSPLRQEQERAVVVLREMREQATA